MRCFFTGILNIFFLTLVLNGFPGHITAYAEWGILPDYDMKIQPLNTQEKAYTYFCIGYFHFLDKDWENAAENFEKALQLDGSSERILRHLATCYFQLGRNEESIHAVEKLIKIKPDDFHTRYTLATLYEITGRIQDAIAEYERAQKCKTTELDRVFLSDTLYKLANLYMQEGMMEKGAECYKSMLDMKLVSDPAKIYSEIGLKYFEKNNIKKSLEYFLKVKEADPDLSLASFYLTLCYDALDDYASAVHEANNFLQKEPNNWIMHFALSEIYGKMNDTKKKDEEIEKVKEILNKNVDNGSKNPKEYFMLCQIYRNQRRISRAIAVIENLKLIPLNKEDYRDIHFLLANLYYENQEFDKVENELLMTLKLDPEYHEACNFLGYFFAENNKNLDEAIRLISKALKAQPKNGAYLDSLGWAYYKKAQKEGGGNYLSMALQKLREAVQFAEEPDIYEHIGDVCYSLGNWDEAVHAFEKAKVLYEKAFNGKARIKNVKDKLEKIKKLISLEKASMEYSVALKG
ncbi:MAG: tetratricopeptide repeat protein [wastewater metagenome]|nr:tetratricopeptide repeat protein [Candidatus Loosdrechtia aerotolerans]